MENKGNLFPFVEEANSFAKSLLYYLKGEQI